MGVVEYIPYRYDPGMEHTAQAPVYYIELRKNVLLWKDGRVSGDGWSGADYMFPDQKLTDCPGFWTNRTQAEQFLAHWAETHPQEFSEYVTERLLA